MIETIWTRLVYALLLAIMLTPFLFIVTKKLVIYGKWLVLIKIVLLILFIVVMTWLNIFRINSLRFTINDNGFFANILWNSIHGRLQISAICNNTIFFQHFSPSLFLLTPFFWIYQSTTCLMILQVLGVACGAPALWAISRHLGWSEKAGLLLGTIWLGSATMFGSVIFDFHEATFISGLLLWVGCFALKGNKLWMCLLALVVMGFKEDMPIYTACLGMLAWWSCGKRTEGLLLLIVSVVYYILFPVLVWSWISPGHENFMEARFPQLHSQDWSIITLLFTDPYSIIKPLLNLDRIWGLLMLFLPVAFLPFRKWGGLALLPALFLLLSIHVFGYYIFSLHYPAPILALVMFATVPGWQTLRSNIHLFRSAGVVMLGFTVSLHLALPPDVLYEHIHPDAYCTHPQITALQRFSHDCPPSLSVGADTFVAPLFTSHEMLVDYPTDTLPDRLALSAASYGSPTLPILINDLGYGSLQSNPCFLLLGRNTGSDARQLYMDKLRWMDAENCRLQSWNLVKSSGAKGGTAVLLKKDNGFGNRYIETPRVIIPKGDYRLGLRLMSLDKISPWQSNIVIEIYANGDHGGKRIISSTVANLLSDGKVDEYQALWVPLHLDRGAFINLVVNFGDQMDILWDGIAIEGLPTSFSEYYQSICPLAIDASAICSNDNLIEESKGSLTGKVVAMDSSSAGQEICRIPIPATFPSGYYLFNYLVNVQAEGKYIIEWGELYQTQSGQAEEEKLSKLKFSTHVMYDEGKYLGSVLVRITPGRELVLKASSKLNTRVDLEKIWLMTM